MFEGKNALVLLLATKGAWARSVKASTVELAKELGASQQSVSRWLFELESEGLMEKTGLGITFSQKARDLLKKEFLFLQEALQGEEKEKTVLEGKAVSGFGDGAYYLSRQGYSRQFKEKLGFTPFPGTLNVKLSAQSAQKRQMQGSFESARAINILGFESEGRKFGGAKCFKARVNGKVDGAIIVPERSHYGEDVLELVSEKNLRKALKLKEGKSVWIEVL